jgi:hypothetical protein
MREAPPEEPIPASSKTSQPVGTEEGSRGKTASAKGKGKKKDKKKAPIGGKGAATRQGEKGADSQRKEESEAGQTGKQTRTTPPDPPASPEAKGRGQACGGQIGKRPGARPTTTSRGECSGQEKPDS